MFKPRGLHHQNAGTRGRSTTAYVFNLARREIIAGIEPENETAVERSARIRKQDSYRRQKDDHLKRYHDALSEEVREAEENLKQAELEESRNKKATLYEKHDSPAVRKAMLELDYRRKWNQPWRPAIERAYVAVEDVPPVKALYAEKHISVKQEIWESERNLDIAYSMLHSIRNYIDIPATVKNMEDFYQAIFGSMCHGIWTFVAGVEYENDRNTRALRRTGITNLDVKMSSEVNRSRYVYRRLANINDKHFRTNQAWNGHAGNCFVGA